MTREMAKLASLLGVEDGPWKFGFPDGMDLYAEAVQRSHCRVCGESWRNHFIWRCPEWRDQ